MNSGTFTKVLIPVIIFLLLSVSQVSAAIINTSSSCSLADAIASAINDSATGGCPAGSGDDTINLDASVNISADFEITGGVLTINGNGYTIDANQNDRHFTMSGGATLNLNNIILTGGRKDGTTSIQVGGSSTVNIANSRVCGNAGAGGSFVDITINVLINSSLTVTNSVICNNSAREGGAIHARGNLTVTNSTIYGNSATATGGAIHVDALGKTVVLRHVTITGNTAPNGAGIYVYEGSPQLRNSIVYGNTGGGADCNRNPPHNLGVNSGNILGASDCGAGVSSSNPRLVNRTGRRTSPNSPHYALGQGSPAIDPDENAVACLSDVTRDQLGTSRPVGGNCDIGAWEGRGVEPETGGGGSGSRGRSKPKATMVPTPTRIPMRQTCLNLMPTGIVVSNRSEGTACQRVDAIGIGKADIIAAGFIDAVDVWGWITPDTKVCFQRAGGSFRFLDAAIAPRSVSELPVFSEAGMTCTTIDRPGTVVLMPDQRRFPLRRRHLSRWRNQRRLRRHRLRKTAARAAA